MPAGTPSSSSLAAACSRRPSASSSTRTFSSPSRFVTRSCAPRRPWIYQAYWSEEILEEVRRNLVRTKTTTEEQAARLVLAMREAFPEAVVTGYEPLVASMANDTDDRHIAAAAVKAGAQVIVTSNLKHFGNLPENVEAQSPDEFLCNLFDLDADAFVERLRAQAAAMRKRPVTLQQLLVGLRNTVPSFAAAVALRVPG
jgi:predicted nucleic acid-binding protein